MVFRLSRSSNPDLRLRGGWAGVVPDHVIAVGWSACGTLVAAAAVSGPVRVFDAATGQVVRAWDGHHFGTTAIAFHPSLPLLATAGQDGKLRLLELRENGASRELPGGTEWIEHLAWSHDGRLLASSGGRKIRLWSPDGELFFESTNHSSTVADLAWRPGSSEVSVASYGAITLWRVSGRDVAPGRSIDFKGSMLKLAWRPDGRFLGVGTQESTVMYWDCRDPSRGPLSMSGFPSKVRELSWSCDSRWLATGGGETISIWDCSGTGPRGRQPLMLDIHRADLTCLHFQRRGPCLASGGEDGLLTVWAAPSFQSPIDEFDFHAPVTTMAWSPDDRSLFAGSDTGAVAMLRLE